MSIEIIEGVWLAISTQGQQLKSLRYVDRGGVACSEAVPEYQQYIERQITSYLADPDFHFDISITVTGTLFQRQVWQELVQIPVGKTRTYGAIAKELKTGSRAVANACRANPTPIIVPCHRLVAKAGLGGYDGQKDGKSIQLKRWLIKHEQS